MERNQPLIDFANIFQHEAFIAKQDSGTGAK